MHSYHQPQVLATMLNQREHRKNHFDAGEARPFKVSELSVTEFMPRPPPGPGCAGGVRLRAAQTR